VEGHHLIEEMAQSLVAEEPEESSSFDCQSLMLAVAGEPLFVAAAGWLMGVQVGRKRMDRHQLLVVEEEAQQTQQVEEQESVVVVEIAKTILALLQ